MRAVESPACAGEACEDHALSIERHVAADLESAFGQLCRGIALGAEPDRLFIVVQSPGAAVQREVWGVGYDELMIDVLGYQRGGLWVEVGLPLCTAPPAKVMPRDVVVRLGVVLLGTLLEVME